MFLHPLIVRMCDSCLALKGKSAPANLNYRNFGDDACWHHTFIDQPTYMRMPGEKSPWSVLEGWSIQTVCYDWMHNVYLGVGKDLVASGIWLFIRQGMYDEYNLDDMDDLLGQIQMDIQAWCKRSKSLGLIGNFHCTLTPNLLPQTTQNRYG